MISMELEREIYEFSILVNDKRHASGRVYQEWVKLRPLIEARIRELERNKKFLEDVCVEYEQTLGFITEERENGLARPPGWKP
jgi:hypothetical protein